MKEVDLFFPGLSVYITCLLKVSFPSSLGLFSLSRPVIFKNKYTSEPWEGSLVKLRLLLSLLPTISCLDNRWGSVICINNLFSVAAAAAGPEQHFQNNCLQPSTLILYLNSSFPEARTLSM